MPLFDQLLQARRSYADLLSEAGGDPGEAYNLSEAARVGQTPRSLHGLSPELLAAVNRIAMTSDPKGGFLSSLLLPAYEGLKGVEQQTGIPTISALSKMGAARVTPMNQHTTQASLLNALSGLFGPALGGSALLRR